MQSVVGRPHRLAGLDPVEEFLRKGAQVAARPEGLLALGQFGDKPVGPGFDAHVSGARIHESAGREIMAHGMAAQLAVGFLPAAIWLRARRQAGGQAEGMEQPVVVQAEHVLEIAVHGFFERAGQEPDLAEGERRVGQGEGRGHFGGPEQRVRRRGSRRLLILPAR